MTNLSENWSQTPKKHLPVGETKGVSRNYFYWRIQPPEWFSAALFDSEDSCVHLNYYCLHLLVVFKIKRVISFKCPLVSAILSPLVQLIWEHFQFQRPDTQIFHHSTFTWTDTSLQSCILKWNTQTCPHSCSLPPTCGLAGQSHFSVT